MWLYYCVASRSLPMRVVKIPAASSGAFRAGGHCADLARSASTCPSKESICYIGGICPPNPLTRMPFLPTASSGASWHDFVNLWLRVENNNKFVRGRTKAREEIEESVLRRYQMQKLSPDRSEYLLTIPYETDKELDDIISDILRDADNTADYRHCFIEADVQSVDDPDRSW